MSKRTINDQIAMLNKQGISVQDRHLFTNAVRNYGYQEIVSQYFGYLREQTDNDIQIDFQDIYDLYQFDQRLKNVMMISLQLFEQTFKIALTRSIEDYFVINDLNGLFAEKYQLQSGRVIRRGDLKTRIRRIKQHFTEPFPGYKEQHEGNITAWVLIKEMSFGIATNAFFLLNGERQQVILDHLFKEPLSLNQFDKLLETVRAFRDRAAHNYRLIGVNIDHQPIYSEILQVLQKLNNVDPYQFALHQIKPIMKSYLVKYPEEAAFVNKQFKLIC